MTVQLTREVVPRNQLEKSKHLNTKIQEVASSLAITEKINVSEKSGRYTRAPGLLSDKVMPDYPYSFTDGPVV